MDAVKQLGRAVQSVWGVVAVVVMFGIFPVAIWWIASPMIQTLPFADETRWLLFTSVLATLTLSGASGFLVLKGMAEEP